MGVQVSQSRSRHLLGVLLAAPGALFAQRMLPGGSTRLLPSDAAILESEEVRKDLPCSVTPVKPVLGFDLKFHSGYEVCVPLKELAGEANQLTIVFRVTPEGHPDDAVYLSHCMSVPSQDEGSKGDAYLRGSFDVGEGKYQVDWLMRDRSERFCSSGWKIKSELPGKDKDMTLDIAANGVEAVDTEPFKQEPLAKRPKRENPLNVRVMVNFAPQDALSATLQPLDTDALVSILKNIARDPRIGKLSVVAFNVQEQRIIYRQESAEQIDFPALGKELHSLDLGTVALQRLVQKHADTDFLGSLMKQAMKGDKEQPDAVIIAGPKVMIDSLPQDTLKDIGKPQFPVFYMSYNPNPQVNPWRDVIGSAVKALKGAEYAISRPRDLFFAWKEIVGHIVKSKSDRAAPLQ